MRLSLNFAITMSKCLWIVLLDPQTTLTMLWNSLSITGQTNEKLTSICFFMITNCQLVSSHSLPHCINCKFMCQFDYWQWKLANECTRVSAVTKKILFCFYWLATVLLEEFCHLSKILILFSPNNLGSGNWLTDVMIIYESCYFFKTK